MSSICLQVFGDVCRPPSTPPLGTHNFPALCGGGAYSCRSDNVDAVTSKEHMVCMRDDCVKCQGSPRHRVQKYSKKPRIRTL